MRLRRSLLLRESKQQILEWQCRNLYAQFVTFRKGSRREWNWFSEETHRPVIREPKNWMFVNCATN